MNKATHAAVDTTAGESARADGPAPQSLAQTLLGAVYRRLRWRLGLRVCGIYVRALETPAPGPDAEIPGFARRIYEHDAVEALLACKARPEMSMSPAFVRSALAKGDACEAILLGNEIVAFNWHAFTPTHDSDGVYVDFARGLRYVYHAYTLPEYRGRHWPRLYKQTRDRYALARGCTHAIAFIAIDNVPSMRSAVAAGNRLVGYAGYLKLGGLFLPFRTPGVADYGFRFFRPRPARGAAS